MLFPFIILVAVLRSFFRIYGDLFRLPEFRGLLITAALFIAFGGVVFRALEGWRWIDAFYFGVVSLTTVGYGDVTPKTDPGKLFAMVYLLAGVGLLSGLIAIVGDGTRRAVAREHAQRVEHEKEMKRRIQAGRDAQTGASSEAADLASPSEPPSVSPPAQE
ncbi:MAG: potassium channel family protein [Anaerolineae bacterium]